VSFTIKNNNNIVCCSETWLQSDKLPATPGFVSYCSPLLGRPTGKKPLPGSCMFISNTFTSSHPEICDIVEQSTTCLNVTCFVAFKHSQTAVLSIYRSPSICCKTAITELQSILLQLLTYVKYFIIAGDFNIDLQSSLSTSNEYKNLLHDFCVTQHIVAPSRVRDSSATLIDHISSSNQFSVTHACQSVGLSDHYIQCVDFRAPVCSQEARTM